MLEINSVSFHEFTSGFINIVTARRLVSADVTRMAGACLHLTLAKGRKSPSLPSALDHQVVTQQGRCTVWDC